MTRPQQGSNADDGWAITVWKDGGWKAWSKLDAKYAEDTLDDWLATIDLADVVQDLNEHAKTIRQKW